MEALSSQPFFPFFPPLSAIHTPEGRYIYLSERSFSLAGIKASALIGRKWQDFAPPDEVDAEIASVRNALATGVPVTLDRVQRSWSALPIALDVTITPIRSRGGAHLVMRTATVIDLGPR